VTTPYHYLDTVSNHWGDYYDALVHGALDLDEDTGESRLRRAGPFIPPLTQPDPGIVVTDALRKELERSGLTGFTFVPVVKEKIVAIDWHEWDPAGAEPDEIPESGEPEDYVDDGEHSPEAAAAMGELWRLEIPELARVERDRRIVASRAELHLLVATTNGLDFVRSPDVGYCFVSDRAREWLETHAGEWVQFEEASLR